MASNLSQSSLLNFGFQNAVNANLLPVFGPANLPVYGPQPKRLPVQKQKAGRPKKLAQPEHDSAFQLLQKQLEAQRKKQKHRKAKLKLLSASTQLHCREAKSA